MRMPPQKKYLPSLMRRDVWCLRGMMQAHTGMIGLNSTCRIAAKHSKMVHTAGYDREEMV